MHSLGTSEHTIMHCCSVRLGVFVRLSSIASPSTTSVNCASALSTMSTSARSNSRLQSTPPTSNATTLQVLMCETSPSRFDYLLLFFQIQSVTRLIGSAAQAVAAFDERRCVTASTTAETFQTSKNAVRTSL